MPHPARQPAPRRFGSRSPATGRGPVRPAAGRRAFGVLAIASLLSGTLPGALPSVTQAAEGLYLTWDDCYLGATATSNVAFACDTDAGQNELYVAFTMPQAADNVVAVEIVVDLQHASAVLPDWWDLEPNGCRWPMNELSSLTAAASFPGRTACLNMWEGAVTPAIAGIAGYTPMQPGGAASQARIKVTASVNPSDARTVDGTSMYYAARITLKHDRTTGAGSCSGCEGSACLVLNSIIIGRLAGSTGGNHFLQMPGPGEANWARWQGGGGANCAAVPVRNRAWGQLKGLYR